MLVLEGRLRLLLQARRRRGIGRHVVDEHRRFRRDAVALEQRLHLVVEPAAGPQAAERPLTPEEERAKEEKEYQQKLMEVTGQLKEVQDRYSQLLRGTTSPEPSQLATEEQIKASRAVQEAYLGTA